MGIRMRESTRQPLGCNRPESHLALAGFEEDPSRADFLRRYSLDRLPNDPKLRQRAAKFLRKQGKADLAREVETRGQLACESQYSPSRTPTIVSPVYHFRALQGFDIGQERKASKGFI